MGDSVDDVVEYYYRYLARNRNLRAHFTQFKKRLKGDRKAAEAEAIVFSLLRAEKLQPEIFEDSSKGGPDFRCAPSANESFVVEVTSLDSVTVSNRSGLPSSITGSGSSAFGLITDRLLSEAKNKAPQLGTVSLPGILAITSDYDFASILLDNLGAEYLMTSAPQWNVPLNGGPSHWTTDLKHSVFHRLSDVLDHSGAPIIEPCRQSIAAILLITINSREVHVAGLLHPEAAYPFNPQWFPKVPFVKFKDQIPRANFATEWIQTSQGNRVAIFPHRRIQ